MAIEIVVTLAIVALAAYIFYKNVKKKSQGGCCSSGCSGNCGGCEMSNKKVK